METQEVAIEVSAGPTFRAATPPPEVKEEESSGTYRPNAMGAGAELFPEVAQSVVVGASLLELCNQKGALMNKRHTTLTPSGDAMREWLLKATPADMATRDRDGDTPLSVLCYNHDAPPFVLAFCDRGANPDVRFYCDDMAIGCTAGKYAEAPCLDMDRYRDQQKLRVVEVVEKESESESSKMWLDVAERYSDEV